MRMHTERPGPHTDDGRHAAAVATSRGTAPRTRRLRREVGLVGVAAMAVAGAAAPALADTPSDPQPLTQEEQRVLDAIDADAIVGHIAHIEDTIGVGVAGSPAERHRAEYIAGELQDLGYAPWTPGTSVDGVDDYFHEFTSDRLTSGVTGSLSIGGREYPTTGPNHSETGIYRGYETAEVTGEIRAIADPAAAVDAPAEDVAGTIVVTTRPDGRDSTTYAPIALALQDKGAAAVVFTYGKYTVSPEGATSSERRFTAVEGDTPITIPVALTTYFDGQEILGQVNGAEGPVTATVANARNTTSQNVLAVKPAAQPTDRSVLIGGHLDSVVGAIGADDNLSGPAEILEIARALRDVPTDYNVIFASWGSEELGLVGSRAFYQEVLEPGDTWKDIVAYYNLDMAATSQESNAYLTIHTPYHDDEGAPVVSWAGNVVSEQAERYWDHANAQGQLDSWWKKEWVNPDESVAVVGREYFGNCSDHASIAGATSSPQVLAGEGIPVVYTFWRDSGAQTGQGNVVEHNYHVVGDRLSWPGDPFTIQGESSPYTGNISPERAKILADIYALSVLDTATGPVYPQAVGQLALEGGKASATVSWDAPDDGGSAITSYDLTLTDVSTGEQVTTAEAAGDATSHTFEGLAPGEYSASISAVNAEGASPIVSSTSAEVAEATVPDAPANPTATGGPASLSVQWEAPDDGGSPITGYTLTVSDDTTVQVDPDQTSHVFTDVPEGEYSVSIVATNALGASASAVTGVVRVSAPGTPSPSSSPSASTSESASADPSPSASASGGLARTGAELPVVAGLAAALLALGALGIARSRRTAAVGQQGE